MFLSKLSADFTKEFQRISRPAHIERMWSEVDKRFDRYWDGLIDAAMPTDLTAQLSANPHFKVSHRPAPGRLDKGARRRALEVEFDAAIASYRKEAEPYRQQFDSDMLAEYLDGAVDSFKADLRNKVPIFRYCIHSKSEVMKKWQSKFAAGKSREYLNVIQNLIDWSSDFQAKWPEAKFSELDDFSLLHADHGLDTPDFDAREELVARGVIGYGIRSCVLYHLSAQWFPYCHRFSNYAMFFLTGGDQLGRLNDSEFLILDDVFETDRSKKMDHNYWYPLSLFTFYSLRIHRRIVQKCAELDLELAPAWRFVYVERFFDEVRRQHADAIATMMTSDDDEKLPYRRRW